MPPIAGVVLAAGSGTRMGAPKGTLEVDGERLVDRAVRVLREGGCPDVFAVVRGGVTVPGAVAVENPDPDRGMRSSLQVAVDATGGYDALALLLADLPGVGPAAVRAVVSAWRPGRIVRARYVGGRGHPIVMSRRRWAEATAFQVPDAGARIYLSLHPHDIDDVAVEGDPSDLDTPADLERWRARPD